MLTRIEVDGFKNLLGFSAEFGPFTCIAGPNAVGKSNLFDAIEFLSLLAEYPLDEAAEKVRETAGLMESSKRLFWTNGEARASEIAIAAEMIVPHAVLDKLNRAAFPQDVYLRYEINLRYDDGLRLLRERLIAPAGTLAQHLRFPHPPGFAELYDRVPSVVSQPGIIFDTESGTLPGASRSQFRPAETRHTVLSQYATADYPTLLAANSELASWRKLSLDPAALRKPDKIGAHQNISSRGEHLPAQIRRLWDSRRVAERVAYDEEEASAMLAARIGQLAGFQKIWIHEDPDTGLMTVRAKLRNGEEMSARDLSDGTLRFLALAALELSPQSRVYCIEEPEASLHPSRFEELFSLLKHLATNPFDVTFTEELEDPEEEAPPLRQVIVNTHSSELVREVYRRSPEDLLMANSALTSGPGGEDARVLVLHPIIGTWRCSKSVRGVNLPVTRYVGDAIRPAVRAGVAEDG
ncbi:MAG: AAA family ATPase [Enhygromyxa sp.]